MSEQLATIIAFALGSVIVSLILITNVLRQIRDELRKGNQR